MYRSIAQPVPQPAVLEPAGGDSRQDTTFVEPSISGARSGVSLNEDFDDSDAEGDETGSEPQLNDSTTSEQSEDGEEITPEEQRGDS